MLSLSTGPEGRPRKRLRSGRGEAVLHTTMAAAGHSLTPCAPSLQRGRGCSFPGGGLRP